jgi:membrane protein implicated in regulation of membrane protease activity
MPDLRDYLWMIWIGVILIAVIIELLTLEFTFLMISVGSLGGLGAELLGAPWWLQILVAAAVSVLLILTIRPVLLRMLQQGADPAPSNLAALFGVSGRVLSPVGDEGGLVKLSNGETWTARLDRSLHGATLGQGDPVTVITIEGSTAVVVPAERTAS